MRRKSQQKIFNEDPPVYVYVPVFLPEAKEIVGSTGLCPERLLLLFSHLMIASLSSKGKKRRWRRYNSGALNTWISMSSRFMKKLLTNNYTKYLDVAEERGLIKRERRQDNHITYQSGRNSQRMSLAGAAICSSSIAKKYRKVQLTDKRCLKVVKAIRECYYNDTNPGAVSHKAPVHEKLFNLSKEFKFRSPEAEDYILNVINCARSDKRKRVLQNYLLMIDSINCTAWSFFKVDAFGGRFHSPWTNVPATLRRFVHHAGEPNEKLVHLDVRNSQVFFIACLCTHPEIVNRVLPEFSYLSEYLFSIKDKPDVQEFSVLCCKGMIYDHLVTALYGNNLSPTQYTKLRGITKRLCLKMLYSKPDSPLTDFKRVFRDQFPSVYSVIEFIKSVPGKNLPSMIPFYTDSYGDYIGDTASYKNLSRMAQLLESRILINKVASALIVRDVRFITIHDSFIVLESDVEKTMMTIKKEFETAGLPTPKISSALLTINIE